ncbi:MAG: sigma-54 dependent transcriptional regulator [Gemmatimonadota bacterium]
MSDAPKILLVDDETSILDTLQVLFRGEGYEVAVAETGQKAIDVLSSGKPDLVLTDIRMPGKTGLEVLAAAHEIDPELPVILMTAQASLQSAVRAVNEGAYYYLQKPFSNDELLAICGRAVETRQLKVENRALKAEIGQQRSAASVTRPIGTAPCFTEVLELAETVAGTDSTALISGESGTGKEVLARYIHARSHRSGGAFLSINCGALPESLLESELFGHVKGSFTGAVKDKDGLLVAAEGGTFFMDEIGEMTPATQVKLLRAIQEREVIPVGSTKAVPVDVRLVAATNRDLETEIDRGTFRSDLYYRLNVIQLHMPPLRERQDDIPLLARYFLEGEAEARDRKRVLEITEEALKLLADYDWPGNVRELENALERAAVVVSGQKIRPEDLPERVRETPAPKLVRNDEARRNPTMEMIEQAYIVWVLQAEGGNKTRAAEVLGIDPSTLYRKLNRYGIGD